MQSTGQTSMQASHPVQLSARTTASSLGSFLRALPAPLAMISHSCERRELAVNLFFILAEAREIDSGSMRLMKGLVVGVLPARHPARQWTPVLSDAQPLSFV